MASPVLSRELLKELRRIVGKGNVLTEAGDLLPFESDALTAYRATPGAVVFVHSTQEIQQVVALLHGDGIPFVPRGAGTGLSGGALADGAVIIELSRLNRILWIDDENRRARVQPGVINAQLNEALAPYGLMYAPDPASETVSTLGGNVAENAGGPHCLKYGVTTNHILAASVVMPDGSLLELPGPGSPGYDLLGLFVGSEGTLGICSEIEVRLVPLPAAVETVLAHFDEIEDAGRAVSAIIATGIVPAALEMIDQNTIKVVEASSFAAGFPTDVAASLIVELDGPRHGLAHQAGEVEALLKKNGARGVARAANEEDREKFWKARKSAFGAMGRIGSDLLVQDATVPRSRLPEVLGRVFEIAREYDLTITNVFHAGDGNLHPNIPFDRRDEGILERIRAASREIMQACVAAGGTITGEHGVGIDKGQYMPLIYSDADLQTMRWVKEIFDPTGLCNPGKLLPAEREPAAVPEGFQAGPTRDRRGKSIAVFIESEFGSDCLADDPGAFAIDGRPPQAVATPGSVAELCELLKLASSSGWTVVPAGRGTWLSTGHPLQRADIVISTLRLNGAVHHHPEDLLATVKAGISLADLNAALAGTRQWWPLDPLGDGTVGGTIATGAAGPLAALYGTPRDLVLGLSAVLADGRVVKAGGRVVKNVAGYDMVKLYTGSWGTLGIITEAHLRLHPRPQADRSLVFKARRPNELAAFARALSGSDRLAPAAAELVSPEAATVFGPEGEQWWMAVRWLGHELAVDDALRAAEDAAASQGIAQERGDKFWGPVAEIERHLRPALTVRADVPLRAMDELIRLATPFAGGQTPPLMASPLLGRLWVFVSPSLYGTAKGERTWALRVEELRREAAESGGFVRVERASAPLRGIVDPWGDPGAAHAIDSGLKNRFDPERILKPGFFVGGL